MDRTNLLEMRKYMKRVFISSVIDEEHNKLRNCVKIILEDNGFEPVMWECIKDLQGLRNPPPEVCEWGG